MQLMVNITWPCTNRIDARHGDYDGRGALSDKQLFRFCSYFLECCIDQIDYMTQMIDPKSLEERIASYCLYEISA